MPLTMEQRYVIKHQMREFTQTNVGLGAYCYVVLFIPLIGDLLNICVSRINTWNLIVIISKMRINSI